MTFKPDRGPLVQKESTRIRNASHLDSLTCWQALQSRDKRFDGQFFAATTNTGLYCRNICPVPFARSANLLYFAAAAAAEAAGYRPCNRCQPQASPGSPAWKGTSAVVSRALRSILSGALTDDSVNGLAGRMGIGPRHLRRLFVKYLGASPAKIASAHRVCLARQMLTHSQLSITEIAHRAGFKSIREFNQVMRVSTGQSPSDVRRLKTGALTNRTELEVRLCYHSPLNWKQLLAVLRARAIPGVEVISETTYSRTVDVMGRPGMLRVSHDESTATIQVGLQLPSYKDLGQIVERLRRVFDLGACPNKIATRLSLDPGLRALPALHQGMRVPGAWDGFEAMVAAALHVSSSPDAAKVTTSNINIAELVNRFGKPIKSEVQGLTHLFPTPEAIASADFSGSGISLSSGAILKKLAIEVLNGEIQLEAQRDLEDTISLLRSKLAVSEHDAHHLALNYFGEPDSFPSEEDGIERANAWRPWRAYAAMLLLYDGDESDLSNSGLVNNP